MKKNLTAVLLLFIFSGFCGLVYQVAWLRLLTLTFGSTVYAVSTLLTAFMGGLALGSISIGRLTPRIRRPLLVYGLLELAVGLYGAATPWLFQALDGIYVPLYRHFPPGSAAFGVVRFVVALAILIVPTALMGGTLPVLARFAIRSEQRTGSGAGLLYFANTAGAVLGCFSAGFLLIPGLGLRRSILLAAAVNVAVFLTAVLLSRLFGESGVTRGPEDPPDVAPGPAPKPAAAGYVDVRFGDTRLRRWFFTFFFLTGMASLAFEVYWTRILVLYLGSSVYAFSVMLTVLLLGLALGSLIVSPACDRLAPRILVRWFGILELALGLIIVIQILQFGGLSGMMGNLGIMFGAGTYWKMIVVFFMAVGQVMLAPTVIMGASFPLAARAVAGPLRRVGRDLGDLYGVNTLGAIVGSFAAGFVLIPVLGVQRSLAATAAVNVAVGAAALFAFPRKHRSTLAVLAAPVAALALFTVIYNAACRENQVLLSAGIFNHQGIRRVLHFEEDVHATVTVEEMIDARGDWRSISLNGVNVAGTSMDLVTVQKMQGHLPLLVHGHARSVLHIGFGSGGTARAVSCYPVEKIRVAEIAPGVVRTSARFFESVNDRFWLDDDRVEITYCDGRNFVLATPEKFDVILSDSIHPKFAGNGSLYTRDYYELCRRRLNPGGVVSQWLPFYSLTPENLKMILRSFQDVFPETFVFYVNSTINPFTIVLGRTEGKKLDVERMETLLAIPAVHDDLAEIGQADPVRLLDNFLFGKKQLTRYTGDVPFHTDDWPAVEYFSARLLDRSESWRINFEELIRYREPVLPYIELGDRPPERREAMIRDLHRYYAATRHNLEGQALFLSGRMEEMLDCFAQALLINPEDREPWEYTKFYLAGKGFPAGA